MVQSGTDTKPNGLVRAIPKDIPSRGDVSTRYSTDMCQHIVSVSALQINMGGTAG